MPTVVVVCDPSPYSYNGIEIFCPTLEFPEPNGFLCVGQPAGFDNGEGIQYYCDVEDSTIPSQAGYYSLVCPSQPVIGGDGIPNCSEGWQSHVAYVPFNTAQLDPLISTAMFGAGFAVFITPWAAAFGFKKLLSMLK